MQRVHRVVSTDQQRSSRGSTRLHNCPQELCQVSSKVDQHADYYTMDCQTLMLGYPMYMVQQLLPPPPSPLPLEMI